MSLNRATLIGHVGQINIKTFDGPSGPKKCATFSLATTERYKDRNGQVVDNTEWHNIVSWNHAELCEKYVQKGTLLYVEGKLRTRSWDDQNGNKRYVTEIMADRIDLLGKKESQPAQSQPAAPAAQPIQQRVPLYQQTTPMPAAGEPMGDDLPFN